MIKKTKILITGAGGYIGSVGTEVLLRKGYNVVALDNFSTGFREPLLLLQKKFGKENLKFYTLDLRDNLMPFFKYETGISSVIHYAGSCQVDESMKNPLKYFENNLIATQNLLKYVVRFNIQNFIFSSTCAVYGKTAYSPIDENHPLIPNNPYGESKKMAEEIIRWYSRVYNLKHIILRYFNVCGANEDGSIGDAKTPSTHLVSNLVRSSLKLQDFSLTCPKVETPDQTPVRDYVNVVDVGNAHVKALNFLLNGGASETINIGTGRGYSVLEIVKQVQSVTGKKFKIQKNPNKRLGEDIITIAGYQKAQQLLGWKPQYSLEESILSLIKWFNLYPEGWKSKPQNPKPSLQIKEAFASLSPEASR